MTWIKAEGGLLVNLDHIESIGVQEVEQGWPARKVAPDGKVMKWAVLAIRPNGGAITLFLRPAGNTGEREAVGMQQHLAAMVGTYDLTSGHMIRFPGADEPKTGLVK